jgi:hypothetical protein
MKVKVPKILAKANFCETNAKHMFAILMQNRFSSYYLEFHILSVGHTL